MDSSQFLIFNGLLVILLVGSFLVLFGKKTHPTRLNLRKGNAPAKEKGAGLDFAGEEELNVLINYNGHLWDAFEVLGVPAGSPSEIIDRAYQQAIHSMDESSRELVDLSYKAICQRMKP